MKLAKKDIILFIGDSVTRAGRDHSNGNDLGNGYSKMVAEKLHAAYPDLELAFYNRGVSGNKVTDLEDRWVEDCLALKPTVISILVGINDTWHTLQSPFFGTKETMEEFEASYRRILQQAKEETGAKIVLMEPFALSYPADRLDWRVDLDPRIQVVRRLAHEFADEFIPLDGMLNAAGMKVGYQTLTGNDGVHPTEAGHEVIAQAWLDVVE